MILSLSLFIASCGLVTSNFRRRLASWLIVWEYNRKMAELARHRGRMQGVVTAMKMRIKVDSLKGKLTHDAAAALNGAVSLCESQLLEIEAIERFRRGMLRSDLRTVCVMSLPYDDRTLIEDSDIRTITGTSALRVVQ